MPSATSSLDTWNEIRKASELGVPDSTLAKEFNVSQPSIRKRRQRENWLTPAKIEAEAAAQAARTKILKRGNPGALVTRVTEGVTNTPKRAVESVAGAIAKLHERNALRVAKMSDAALKGVASAPPEIESWADVGQAYKLLRLAAGVDREGVALQLNFGAFGGAGQQAVGGAGPVDAPVLDVGAVDLGD